MYLRNLSPEEIRSGDRVIAEMDKARFHVTAAIWFYSPEDLYWRLLVATPLVDSIGPIKAYSHLHPIVKRALGENSPEIEVSLVSPNDYRVRSFRQNFHRNETEPPTEFNSLMGDSAYVYRV